MSNEPTNPEFPSPQNDEPDSNPGFDSTGPAVDTLPPPRPHPYPQPVPARRRNRPAIVLGVIVAALLSLLVALVGIVVIGIAAVAAIASGEFNIETDAVDVTYTPDTLADLPTDIYEEKGAIEIDLTEINIGEWVTSEGPVELDVRAEYGSITVIVPDEVDVSVEASVDLGEATVFGDSSNGFGGSVIKRSDAASLDLDLDLDVGAIEVKRG